MFFKNKIIGEQNYVQESNNVTRQQLEVHFTFNNQLKIIFNIY